MTPTRFTRIAKQMFGPELGWQTRTANALHINRSNITKWLADGSIPEWAAGYIECLYEAHSRKPRNRKAQL